MAVWGPTPSTPTPGRALSAPQSPTTPTQPAAAPPSAPGATPTPAPIPTAPADLSAVKPPDQGAYQIPGQAALAQHLAAYREQPPIAPDLTQFDTSWNAQQAFLDQLNGLATGKTPTAAQTQGAIGLQSAQAEAQGASTAASRSAPAAQALRQENVAQTMAQSQVLRHTAILSAEQQRTAQQQAAQVSSQMAGEALQKQQLQTQAQEANANFQQNVMGDEFNLANMQQHANIAYAQANQSYQQWQYQQAVTARMNDQQQTMKWISAGITTAGAVAAIAFSGGAATPFAAPIAAGAIGNAVAGTR